MYSDTIDLNPRFKMKIYAEFAIRLKYAGQVLKANVFIFSQGIEFECKTGNFNLSLFH